MLEGQGPRTHAQVFSKKKVFKIFFQEFYNKTKKGLQKIFQAISKREKQKRFLQIFREVSGVFLHNFKNEQIPTIAGTDVNAHHTLWGSSDINPRGEDLLAYCVSTDLNFSNVL